MRIRYTSTALADLDEILRYIARDNAIAARAVSHRIEQIVREIGRFPGMAAVRADEPGVRVMPVGRYPYLVFYTVESDTVVILRIRHAARQRP